VTFTNQSAGDFDQVLWDFGDGITNTTINPTHIYDASGVYTVTLQVSGPGGVSRRIREAYISVLAPEWKFYLPSLIK
jgi:PKD repeat protein